MTTINNNFSRALLEARMRSGLSQGAFSERFGLKQQTYQNYEKGRVPKNSAVLNRLAEGLGITVDQLIGFGKPYNTNNDDRGDSVVKEASDIRFGASEPSWKSAPTPQLEDLLNRCVTEKDYGAVGKVADELLSRKIQEKLK